MKLLLSADLHLGRSSSGLPEAAGEAVPPLSARAAWGRMVDLAVREKCDAVLLAGDLVESSSAFYEALGPLLEGFGRLRDAGIHVFAVGGNHDAGAFAKIAREVASWDTVHFLGAAGQWERGGCTTAAGETLWVDGWSFRTPSYLGDPLNDYRLPPCEGGLLLGLLHADLEAPRSRYAPVTRSALRNLPHRFWLLGHVHKPSFLAGEPQAGILYPGSPQALDFGETGPHGVWLLETGGGPLLPVLRPLSTIRYEDSLRVALSADLAEETLENCLLTAARAHIKNLPAGEADELCCLVHRCAFTGEFPHPQAIAELSARLPALTSAPHDGVRIFFQSARDETTLPLDLEALRLRGGALGELANRQAQLLSAEWRSAPWFAKLQEEIVRAFQRCPLPGDGEEAENDAGTGQSAPPHPEQTRQWLLERGKLLLCQARAQLQEGRP